MNARRCGMGLAFFFLFTLLAAAMSEAKPKPPIFKSPLGLAIDPGGQLAYVALHTANRLAVVDLVGDKVLAEIYVGKKPYDVALHKGIAYVTCEADDTLVAVDVATRSVRQVFKVGQAPRGVAVDPETGLIQVVCHDENVLWSMHFATGQVWKDPIPPQPEGNFARASNLELAVGERNTTYEQIPRPHGLFGRGESLSNPKSMSQLSRTNILRARRSDSSAAGRTAFSPMLDLDLSRTGMDLVVDTQPRLACAPTKNAPGGRVFTNALSFFVTDPGSAHTVLLDEPTRAIPIQPMWWCDCRAQERPRSRCRRYLNRLMSVRIPSMGLARSSAAAAPIRWSWST